MSYNAFAAPLRLELKPARLRRYWRWLTHAAVLSTLPFLQSPWLIAGTVVLVSVSLYRTRTDSPLTLLWHTEGQWTLFESGNSVTSRITGMAFVQTWLVILPLQDCVSQRSRHIAIFPDELPEQAFRRLRARLLSHRYVQGVTDDVQ